MRQTDGGAHVDLPAHGPLHLLVPAQEFADSGTTIEFGRGQTIEVERLHAEKDGYVTPQVAKDTDAAIKKAGRQSEIHIYPGVDHAFFNDERADVYNKAAADDAWRRTLTFFRQHLA